MASIAGTLERIKDDLESFVPESEIRAACREAGYTWRERKCAPVKTIHLFILQILCFNTAMTHLRLLGKAAVAAPAYCRTRMRLPLEVLQKLLRRSATVLSASHSSRRQGRRKDKHCGCGQSKHRRRRPGQGGQPSSRFVKRLGKHDQIVEWCKPRRRPKWMTAEQYESLPALLLVRELRYRLPRKGQRTLCVTIATSLLDAVRYPKDKIAELYKSH